MKTLLIAATVAILALVVLEIAQSDASPHGHRRCSQRERPPLNTTSVTCDSSQRHRPSLRADCNRRCLNCYERQTLQRPPSCRVNGTCTCLAKPGSATSTTPASVTSTAAPATQQPTTAGQQPTTAAAP
ncbi:hypothetical protein Ocin01_14768 [Orchesella cincta]|uniref:Uncharacterized protein n=1 Tax=Orchesella cincta TaxID=48709 RepID=A0A1D2MGC3_ORCCI|nr:hypothetical protein Ocin01_14768 [Orchesella cincta]